MNLRPSSKIHLVIIFLYTSNRISLTWMWIRSVLEVFYFGWMLAAKWPWSIVISFYHVIAEVGRAHLTIVVCGGKGHFLNAFILSCWTSFLPFTVDVTGAISREHHISSHRCLTDCKSLNNVRLYSLSVNLKWQRTIRNKNNTFFYSLWKCLNDCNSEVKGIWVFHSYSRLDVLTNGLMLQ